MLQLRSIFDFENKKKKLEKLNIEINDKDFWNNPQRAQKVSIEASTIEKLISSLENLETNLSDIKELIEISTNHKDDFYIFSGDDPSFLNLLIIFSTST